MDSRVPSDSVIVKLSTLKYKIPFLTFVSLPALLTPVKNKSHLTKMLMGDFVVVLFFYLLLCVTAAFCFDTQTLQDLYTLNFLLDCQGNGDIFYKILLNIFSVFFQNIIIFKFAVQM